jgi:adenine-specific DNA-methyltransferase
MPRTWWSKPEYSARDSGTRTVADLFGGTKPFEFPKAVAAVEDSIKIICPNDDGVILDYFAGSGTTGHAVISLNRQDGGNRKYILVEMGEYFDTVTLPRMKKVVYSTDWKNGKPQSRNTGVSHLIKYITLESYDDALANIELPESQMAPSLFKEEYLLKYMLSTEAEGASLLPLDRLATPFDYEMKIAQAIESKKQVIDLPETFNCLVGLTVIKSHAKASFGAEFSKGQHGALTAILSDGETYAFKAIEGTLPNSDTALIIWRTHTGDIQKDNAVLDAYRERFGKYKKVFVNGDCNLEDVLLTEEVMKQKMFEGV